MFQQMASVAELEAGMISVRTKAALAAAKDRGVKLGGKRSTKLDDVARAAGRKVIAERAAGRAAGPCRYRRRVTGGRRNVATGHCRGAQWHPDRRRVRSMAGRTGAAGAGELPA
jgi:DNA invertase Pin-like site-specific DNA recombinase